MARGERRILDELSPAPQEPPQSPRPQGPPPPSGPLARPWVCQAILAGSVLLFVLESFAPGLVLPWGGPAAVELGLPKPFALYGPLVQRGEYWRLLGFAFEHGGALHLFFNMSAVWTLGMTLERGLGSGRFLMLSLITCVGSGAFALLFNFNVLTVGASGMILGWAGAMLPISTRQGQRELGIWLVQVAAISLLPGVSWAGHLGGFLFGVPCGLGLRLGRAVYTRATPLLLAIASVVAFIAAHPERFRSP